MGACAEQRQQRQPTCMLISGSRLAGAPPGSAGAAPPSMPLSACASCCCCSARASAGGGRRGGAQCVRGHTTGALAFVQQHVGCVGPAHLRLAAACGTCPHPPHMKVQQRGGPSRPALHGLLSASRRHIGQPVLPAHPPPARRAAAGSAAEGTPLPGAARAQSARRSRRGAGSWGHQCTSAGQEREGRVRVRAKCVCIVRAWRAEVTGADGRVPRVRGEGVAQRGRGLAHCSCSTYDACWPIRPVQRRIQGPEQPGQMPVNPPTCVR